MRLDMRFNQMTRTCRREPGTRGEASRGWPAGLGGIPALVVEFVAVLAHAKSSYLFYYHERSEIYHPHY